MYQTPETMHLNSMHLFVDNLSNVDFSYLHPERGLLGETWMAHIQLEGELDEQGMVCDFGIVKKVLRDWLDEEIDHRLAVPLYAPNLELLENGDTIELVWHYGSSSRGDSNNNNDNKGNNNKDNNKRRQLRCKCPRQAIALIEAETVNIDSVSLWAKQQLAIHFPTRIEKLNLDFSTENFNTPNNAENINSKQAFYHYSHGLKKHAGNCQRIAHGHRSRIEIWQDNQRSAKLEQQWAKLWQDIYIGSGDDIINEDDQNLYFAYTSAQGDFELDIPKSDCYQLNHDSTVEFIAQHIATTLKSQHPQSTIRVRAFEGIHKGAQIEL